MSLEKLHKKLIRKSMTISVAESCTGGLLSNKLTKLSGSSKYFQMGFITYSNDAKINVLRIKKKIINKYGAVSSECCRSMVENLSKLSKSKINVSITGVAGPNGGTKLKPVGLVYIGIKIYNNNYIFKKIYKGKRLDIQRKTRDFIFRKINQLI